MSERKGTKALELWCKRLVKGCPNVQIDNMTTSWRNGIAFCALVHHFRPDLIDVSKLKPENIYENNQLAFNLAEKHLGIPALLDPEDMVESDVPDRLSILTYLSQFYQRLGHTVNTKSTEVESKTSTSVSPTETPIKFGKSGLDKCAACGLPVYLAQRLIVSHKLYHRRCFRCSKCSGHINPKNFNIIEGSEFTCDSCKNESTLSKFLNNNDHDQMGMLAFTDDFRVKTPEIEKEVSIITKHKARPLSILEKINMFEKNSEKDSTDAVVDKVSKICLKENIDINHSELSTPTLVSSAPEMAIESDASIKPKTFLDESDLEKEVPSKLYKSNINKFNFLQTQLSNDTLTLTDSINTTVSVESTDISKTHNNEDCPSDSVKFESNDVHDISGDTGLKEDSNITDDSRLAKDILTCPESLNPKDNITEIIKIDNEPEVSISVPPRRKKQNSPNNKNLPPPKKEEKKPATKEYPINLNPFSDEEDEDEVHQAPERRVSTNPFGSSEEEDDDVPPIPPSNLNTSNVGPSPKRLIKAFNPFWSDGEEPSSEDEETQDSSGVLKFSLASSTPNLPAGTPRHRKSRAPPPPRPPLPIIKVSDTPFDEPSTSMDDVASISSLSSYNSTAHSDQKSFGRSTPHLKRAAPTPPGSFCVASTAGSLDKDLDASGARSNISDCSRRTKGPAPGLPLPERREVKLQMSPEDLHVQLDLLETQQLGLERQGVLIEQMIRDKCEGDEPTMVPQEEVEDLVIQLCELVNEKNDLFRKQTELMYIRRQQRLEQEQADIEHEIRIIQSRPAVNRIDADKAREEQLVARLVEIVRLRDEVVQQVDAERRRERREDRAIAASIASKRAQRNSESNCSSTKSMEATPTPKKNKVKDKMKKHLKKAKHTFISKKKDESREKNEEKEKSGKDQKIK